MTGIQLIFLSNFVSGGGDSFFIASADGAKYGPTVIHRDSDGNVYLASPNSAINQYVTIQKLDADLVSQWSQSFKYNTGGVNANWGLGTDLDGNVYLSVPVMNNDFTQNGLSVVSYTSSGALRWQSKGIYTDSPTYVVNTNGQYKYVEIGNEVYAFTYQFSGSSYLQNSLIAALSKSNGSLQSSLSKYFKVSSTDTYLAAVDQDGTDIYLLSRYNSGGARANVSKYDTTTQTFTQIRELYRSSYNFYPYDMCVRDGHIYVVGYTPEAANYYPQIVKMTTSGTVVWQKRIPTSTSMTDAFPRRSSLVDKVAVDSSGNVYVIGVQGLNVGSPTTFGSARNDTVYLLKLDSSGNSVYGRSLKTSIQFENVSVTGLSITENDNIFLGFQGTNKSQVSSAAAPETTEKFMALLPGDGSATGVYDVGSYKFDYSPDAQLPGIVAGTLANTAGQTPVSATPNSFFGQNRLPSTSGVTVSSTAADISPSYGSASFTLAGTYCWPIPSGVTSVSAVAVGAGGSTNHTYSGSGGGLAYANNISVIPGSFKTITVGRPGAPNSSYYQGGSSSFGCHAAASGGNRASSGGTVIAGTGFTGGATTGSYTSGGGAAGYSGNGGDGGGSCGTGYSGSGGSASGGGGPRSYICCSYPYYYICGFTGGGGVGIYGQGASLGPTPIQTGGYGGSGGGQGSRQQCNFNSRAGNYGGGGASRSMCLYGCANPVLCNSVWGAGGAVRVVWPGCARQYPSTCVGADS